MEQRTGMLDIMASPQVVNAKPHAIVHGLEIA